jgi:hypothetical protein
MRAGRAIVSVMLNQVMLSPILTSTAVLAYGGANTVLTRRCGQKPCFSVG